MFFFSPSHACRYLCESVVASYRVTMELNFFQLEYVLILYVKMQVLSVQDPILIIQALSKGFLVTQILELVFPKNKIILSFFLNKLDLQLCTYQSSTAVIQFQVIRQAIVLCVCKSYLNVCKYLGMYKYNMQIQFELSQIPTQLPTQVY